MKIILTATVLLIPISFFFGDLSSGTEGALLAVQVAVFSILLWTY
jgi:hypothetical protein